MLFVLCMAGAFFFFQKDASKDISTDQAPTIIEMDSNDTALFEQGTYGGGVPLNDVAQAILCEYLIVPYICKDRIFSR